MGQIDSVSLASERPKGFWGIFRFRKLRKYDKLLSQLKEIEGLISENATQLERAKSSFLKNIYHEIRTPLNSIVGFTSLLEQKDLSDEQKQRYNGNVNRSSKEFLRIMDDIVQASLLEAGMVKLHTEPCKPYRLMNELHAYFTIRKHLLEKNNIALLQNIPDESRDICMMVDGPRINQVMTHLLDNALKFTDKGIIEYGYKVYENEIKFYVRDSGVGGLDKYKELVFQSFSKMDISDSAREGLGLGLNISKKLVELMEGTINCSTNKKSGTIFTFSIPYVQIKLKVKKTDTAEQNEKKKHSILGSIAF